MLCFRQCGHVSEDLRGAARRWHVPRERGKMPHRWDGPTGVVRWRWGACGPPRCLPRATHSLGRLFTLNPINGTAATAAAQPGAGRAAPAQPGSDQCLMPAAGTALLFSPFPSSPFPSPFHFSPLSFLCTFRCVPSLPSSLPRALPAQQTWGGPSPWVSPPPAAPRGCSAAPRAGCGPRSPVLRLEVALHEALCMGRRGTAGTAALLRDRLRGQGTSGVSPGHRGGTGSQARLRRPHGLCGTGSDPCPAPRASAAGGFLGTSPRGQQGPKPQPGAALGQGGPRRAEPCGSRGSELPCEFPCSDPYRTGMKT